MSRHSRGFCKAKMTPSMVRSFRRLQHKCATLSEVIELGNFPISISQASRIRSNQHWTTRS